MKKYKRHIAKYILYESNTLKYAYEYMREYNCSIAPVFDDAVYFLTEIYDAYGSSIEEADEFAEEILRRIIWTSDICAENLEYEFIFNHTVYIQFQLFKKP